MDVSPCGVCEHDFVSNGRVEIGVLDCVDAITLRHVGAVKVAVMPIRAHGSDATRPGFPHDKFDFNFPPTRNLCPINCYLNLGENGACPCPEVRANPQSEDIIIVACDIATHLDGLAVPRLKCVRENAKGSITCPLHEDSCLSLSTHEFRRRAFAVDTT